MNMNLNLNMEEEEEEVEVEEAQPHVSKRARRTLLLLNALILTAGKCGAPLILRLYFLHGGNRLWLSSWLQSGGWPLNFLPLSLTYLRRPRRRRRSAPAPLFLMIPPVFAASAVLGVLAGFDNYLYAYGVARLPASTTALIMSSELAFTAVLAYLLLGQGFTAYSINAIVLLTVGPVVLALHTGGDRPEAESKKDYFMGFLLSIAASVLYALIMPLVELTYKKAKQAITYTLVLEIQLVMCFFATVVCTVGMVITNDFQAIPREARAFGLGETTYYVVLVGSAVFFQFFFLGAIGVIFSASSLVSAIMMAGLLPVREILAVIFYREKFQAEKGVSLFLSLWGFVSYFYGELKHSKKKREDTQNSETEMLQTISAP